MRNGYENATCISIHAPTRGATTKTDDVDMAILFQSTLPREERLHGSSRRRQLQDFNPRSHERSDLDAIGKGISIMISIHAPTRGATLAQSA